MPLPLEQDVLNRLQSVFTSSDDVIAFTDPNMDGRHFHLRIVSETFEGKTRLQRHQIVYAVLGDLIGTGQIHALEMNLSPPSE